ncbi:MAG: succinylglutamate desuccinylase/aspartoacylase family protein [Sandaracinaceae bacterium]|nr:succinylglutamate desuccinylase/aspartoacylase family protein [Sandaracinaceae bacterium]
MSEPRHVERLDLDELPSGRPVRLWLDLVHDAMGMPLAIPVIVVRGPRAGPVFGITAAVHGNELNGLPVIHRLVERLDATKLRGTIVMAAPLNVPGFHRNARRFVDQRDLNTMFPGRADGHASHVFAFRLMDRLVRHFDFLVDLHTASFGRENSLYVRADMRHPMTAKLAKLARPEIILHNPPSDRTLRGAAAELEIPAITVEIGDPQVLQPKYIKPTLTGIRSMLAAVEMLPKRTVASGPAPILCDSSRWIYTDFGGLLSVTPQLTDRVRRGDRIARQRDVFGDVVREYHAPFDGVIIGRSTNPVGQTGARIVHLGRLTESLPPPAVEAWAESAED